MKDPVWIKGDIQDLVEDFVETFCGWEIYLFIPNGGILGASIICGNLGYYFDSESLEEELYFNKDWHIQEAKKKILSLNSNQPPKKKRKRSSPPNQLKLNLDM